MTLFRKLIARGEKKKWYIRRGLEDHKQLDLTPSFFFAPVMTSSGSIHPYVEHLIHILRPYRPINLPIILINISSKSCKIPSYIQSITSSYIQSITSNGLPTFGNDIKYTWAAWCVNFALTRSGGVRYPPAVKPGSHLRFEDEPASVVAGAFTLSRRFERDSAAIRLSILRRSSYQ